MRVRVYCSADFDAWRRDAEHGLRPGLAPYGLEHLAANGMALVPRQPPAWLTGRLRTRLVSNAEWRFVSVVQPLQLLRGREEVALAVLEREGWAHAMLKRAGMHPWSDVPLVLVSCWLADEAMRASGARLRRLAVLAQAADLIVFWSRNQQAIFRDVLGVEENRLCYVPFGVETDFFRPVRGVRQHFVLTVGRDRGRDYRTFLAAANRLEVPVKVVCPPEALRGLPVARHVELLGEVSHVELRRLLGEAAVVAIAVDPDVAYPSGQTVLLNAMAVGTPTVITESAAIRDYAHHGENAWLAPAGDPVALHAAIVRLLGDEGLRERIADGGITDVRRRFNASAMWASVAAHMRGLKANISQ